MREAAEKTTTVFADKDLAMRWQLILLEKGWAVPAWPVEHGGTNWSPTQKYIWSEECSRAHAPGLIPLGLRMLAPVIFKYGTDEQKSYYLPRMLTGEHYCQAFALVYGFETVALRLLAGLYDRPVRPVPHF